MKIWGLLGVIGIILVILYYLYSQGIEKGSESQKNEINEQIIKNKDEIIKVKKKQFKIISNPTNDNINYRSEWLQFIWEEKNRDRNKQ